uniref:mitogen-activated protein kinase kinase kinase n=2 Tax=Vitis vinifera TaxID=29760 RepID=F6H7H3_VITVI
MDWTRGCTLGRGSSATVSIATSHLSGDIFAVKSTELSQSKLLKREQRILSTVRSAHVIEYRGWNVTCENGKQMYNLCMEYAAGGTLKQRGSLGEAAIRANTRAILQGLQYLHSNCIVHCDIKSENILITGEGLKIGDLGCARLADDFSDSVCGTPAFMAPEVARGEEQGFAADVWALGCTIIEMATGRAPWTDVSDPVSAVYRIGFSGDVPEIPGWVSEEAKDFLGKCLVRDPVKRWSVGELLGHPFVNEACVFSKEVYGSSSSSPTSVLDQRFWSSSIEELYPFHKKSWNSPRERIQFLANSNSNSGLPNWGWDENWVTVRSGSMEELEVVSEAPTATMAWAGEDPGMVGFREPTPTAAMDSCNSCNLSRLKCKCMNYVFCGNLNFDFVANFNDSSSLIINPFSVMENRGAQPPIELMVEATSNSTSQEYHSHESIVSKPPLESFLTRLHAGYFRISLSLGSQALLWKTLSEAKSDLQPLRHVSQMLPLLAFLLLWYLSFFTLISLSFLYILRCFFHFQMVKAEFLHHVGVNYLFAPWISWLLLLQSAPLVVPNTLSYLVLWWVFAIPVLALDIKIYGQWFTTEKRFFSMVANPTSQISVIGNLAGAQAAALMGWKESAVCMFTLGMVHYLVVFVTLYQRLSGGDRLPVMLRPVFFLFFAAPSMASLAWKSISGTFDTTSKMLFFLSLFLFTSLACRPTLFKKSMRKFNVAWWAYSFPLTFLALASAEYAQKVEGEIAPVLMLMLIAFSVLVCLSLMLFTALNTKALLLGNDPILKFCKSQNKEGLTMVYRNGG